MSAMSLRTMIFVPGYKRKYLEKAQGFEADALILDLEDSVPQVFKEDARRNIREYLERKAYSQQIFIRVNPAASGMLLADLEAVLHEEVTGIMFTKVAGDRDIRYFDELLTQLEAAGGIPRGTFTMCPLIETASAVLRSYEIATASSRMVGIAFGAEDYLTDLDGLHKEHGTSLLVPRSLIVIAARAAGIEAIDTPYLDVHNMEGFRKELHLARELGFSGSLILHPDQLAAGMQIFSPDQDELDESKRIIEAIQASEKEGLGVALLDGKLIGPPMKTRAENVLAKQARIDRMPDQEV